VQQQFNPPDVKEMSWIEKMSGYLSFLLQVDKIISFRIYISRCNLYHLAGIGTLDFPGCQRVSEPVSYLFYINPYYLLKSKRITQNKATILYFPIDGRVFLDN
jgi:hypothetical protein